MTRPDVVMTEQRLRDVEGLAHTMLLESVSISPYQLADRAKINWFNARDVLQGLVRKGYARALVDGHFGRSLDISQTSEREHGVTITEHAGLPRPESAEDVRDAESIAGMRRAILGGARYSSMIRQCLEVARSRLLSREEIYVFLAYEALLRLKELRQAREHLKGARLAPLTRADTERSLLGQPSRKRGAGPAVARGRAHPHRRIHGPEKD